MTVPVDGYAPQNVTYTFMADGSPNYVGGNIAFPLGGPQERDVVFAAAELAMAAFLDHIQTEEPTWNAAVQDRFFPGQKNIGA